MTFANTRQNQKQKPKRAAKDQTKIPGTYDEPVPAVQQAAELYADTLHQRQALQTTEADLRADLVEQMQTHGVEECAIDGYVVKLNHRGDNIKVEKIKGDGGEG